MLKAALGLLNLVVVLALALMATAGTVRWAQGWVLLGLFSASSLAITIYLARNDPALLKRRTHAGPFAETARSQRIVQALASISFLSTVIVPALDHRFDWSHASLPVVVSGDALVVLGFLVVFRVFRENTFTSSIIEVTSEQRVIDSGPYALVRHPMYAGAAVLVVGIPLALGSVVGLATLPPFIAIIVWRLMDEERFLTDRLPGYAAYCSRIRCRLIPRLW
jgi:protein-S-isoprenylcysteine O-methyltransferase Ste14